MTAQPTHAELLVVGGGPGGYVAAIKAAQHGLETVLVERESVGGVCLNHGCIPSKAMLDVAKRIEGVGDLPGVDRSPTVDPEALDQWRSSVVETLTGGVDRLCSTNGVTTVSGTARFVDAATVEVAPSRLTEDAVYITFDTCIVATGSRPLELPGFSFDDDPVMNSRQALHADTIPDRLVVVGAGYVGMELSTAFAYLGADVTVIEALEAPLPGFAGDLVGPVRERLEAAGVDFHFGEQAVEWYEDIAGDTVVVTASDDGTRNEYPANAVLVAVGREPVTETVDPAAVGLETNDGAIQVDEVGRTGVDSIYAIGDVTGDPMLAHEASHEGLRAVADVVGRDPPPESASPQVVFTDPEIATVGLPSEAASQRGRDVATGRSPFRANGRALTAGQPEGFVRVLADPGEGTLLGAELVGPEASELVGELSVAITAGLSARQVAASVHAHPTLGEAIEEAAAAVEGEAIHTPNR